MKNILILAVLTLTSTTTLADFADGKIQKIKFFNAGQEAGTFIYMDSLPKACGTGHQRISLMNSNPSHDAVLSAALAAKLSDARVRITYKSTCNDQTISWDFNDLTLF